MDKKQKSGNGAKYIGTGYAKEAAKKLGGREAQLQRQECKSMGGKWVPGKGCIY